MDLNIEQWADQVAEIALNKDHPKNKEALQVILKVAEGVKNKDKEAIMRALALLKAILKKQKVKAQPKKDESKKDKSKKFKAYYGTKLDYLKKLKNGKSKKEKPEKYQKGKPIKPYTFYRQSGNLGNGKKIISESIYNGTTNQLHDFLKPISGRNIYYSPEKSDTIYWNYPERFMEYSNYPLEGGGFMPVGEGASDLNKAKLKFLKKIKLASPYQDNKESKNAFNRAIKE